MSKDFSTKLNSENNVIGKTIDTMCLTFKVAVPHKHSYLLDSLYTKSFDVANRMILDRAKTSSKHWKEIPCAVAKSLSSKYQRNKKLKKISRLVIPICGDKGKQVKIVEGGVRIPSLFKKEVIPLTFPRPIIGFIRQVEFSKIDGQWLMSYSYNTPVESKIEPKDKTKTIGVDRNSVGNVATVSTPDGKIKFLGPSTAGIAKNFRNRRAKLQRKGAKNALKKIKRKQSRRIKHINHIVSKQIVNLAKEHNSAIVLENLSGLNKGKAKRYVKKSNWSFYQLEQFILYKANLLGLPAYYIDPRNTSKQCSKCGSINATSGKKYHCSVCGYVAHRDANAALNIRSRWVEQTESCNSVGLIGDSLNQRTNEVVQLESLGGAR